MQIFVSSKKSCYKLSTSFQKGYQQYFWGYQQSYELFILQFEG